MSVFLTTLNQSLWLWLCLSYGIRIMIALPRTGKMKVPTKIASSLEKEVIRRGLQNLSCWKKAEDPKTQVVALRLSSQQQHFQDFTQGSLMNSSPWAFPGQSSFQSCFVNCGGWVICDLWSASQTRRVLLLVSVPDSNNSYSDQQSRGH